MKPKILSQAELASEMLTDSVILNAFLASIIESSDDAIIGKTLEGIILSWNKGAERIFGFTEREAIGQSILLIIPKDRQHEETEILSRIRRGERIDHFETIRQHKDGTLLEISLTTSPIKNRDGVIIGASKVARDITDQKRVQERFRAELETQVRLRTEELTKANKEMEGFTYSVSHDLRAPLRAIVSSSMILREEYADKLPAEAAEELERQAIAANRVAKLIDDLLRFSRIGRQELTRRDLDVTAISREIAQDLQAAYPSTVFDIDEGLTAYGDPPTIRLVLGNLMENACKFSAGQGTVQVGCDNGAIFVRDQGIGFNQAYAEKVFLPFERLVLDRDYPGTGIGLANVKRIIDRHGGKLWGESQGANAGATFYFALPRE